MESEIIINNSIESETKKDVNTFTFFSFLYYSFFTIATIHFFLGRTTINSSSIQQPLLWISFIFSGLIIVKIIYEWKTWTPKNAMLFALLILPIIISSIHIRQYYALEYCLLMIGAKGIKKKTLLYYFLLLNSAMTFLTLILCFLGKIENVITYRDEFSTHARMSLGFSYATVLTAQILAIVLVWAYLRIKKVKWLEIAIIFALGIFSYYIAEARISSFSIILISITLIAYKTGLGAILDKFISNNKFCRIVLTFASVFVFFICIILSFLYIKVLPTSIGNMLDDLSSGRVAPNATAHIRYPLTFLSQSITELGTQANGQIGVQSYYFSLNTSYISILYKLGILSFIALIILWCMHSYHEVKNKNYAAAILLLIFSVYCYFENRLLAICYNPFFLLIFIEDYNLPFLIRIKAGLKIPSDKLKLIASSIIVATLIEIVIFNYQSVITYANDETSLAKCNQAMQYINWTELGTLQCTNDSGQILACIPTYTGLESIYIDMNVFNTDNPYKKLKHHETVIDIYEYHQEGNIFIESVTIDSDNPSSWYIPLSMDGIYQNLCFNFHIDNTKQFSFNKFAFNVAKPFDLNYIRILLFFIILFPLSLLITSKSRSLNPKDK